MIGLDSRSSNQAEACPGFYSSGEDFIFKGAEIALEGSMPTPIPPCIKNNKNFCPLGRTNRRGGQKNILISIYI